MTEVDWNNQDQRLIAAEMRVAAGTPDYVARNSREDAIFAVFNAGEEQVVFLPPVPLDRVWVLQVDTAHPGEPPTRIHRALRVAADSVVVLALEPTPIPLRS
jgi:glycogen operon protein